MSHLPSHYLRRRKGARFPLTTSVGLLALATSVQGLVVNLDIEPATGSTFSGQGAYQDPGHDYWNSSAAGMTNLVASDGVTVTGVEVTLSTGSRHNALGGNVPAGQSHSELMGDYAYSRDADTTVDLAGLTPGGDYLVYFYCQGDQLGQKATVTLDGRTVDTSGLLDGTIAENGNYVVLPVTADGNGEVTGLVARQGSRYAACNGLQIVELARVEPVAGSVINVDLGGNTVGTAGDGSNSTGTPYSGQGAYSEPGNDFWNNDFTTGKRTERNLLASDGTTVTPVKVTLSGGGGFEDVGKTNHLLSDYFYGNITAAVSALEPNRNYTVYVYAAGDKSGQGSAITVNGVSKSVSNSGDPDFLSQGVNYEVFDVTADIAGRLSIECSDKLNGFQVIPGEPAASAWQAEAASYSGLSLVSESAAFGDSALNGFETGGDYVTFQSLPEGNTLTVTYANGGAATTRASLWVDSVEVGKVFFPPTGGWSTFAAVTLPGLAVAANGEVKLTLDAADVAFNNSQEAAVLDQIELTDEGGLIEVSTVLDLIAQLGKDNVTVKMTPGSYDLDELDKDSGLLPVPVLFDFYGSNSTFDFTGVTFNVHTNLYNEWGSSEVRVIEINGHNNHLFGLTQKDIGDEPINSTGVLNLAVVGDGNKVEEISIYTRSSTPYGYGDLFGKGSGAVIGHNKHAALLVNGADNHLLNCFIEMATYGHGIFMQGAIGTLVEGCFVRGETSNTDVVLAEEGTGSQADQVDFMTVWGWRVPPGYGFSLQEDGIRCYNNGANGLNTANTTVRNCTVEYMRSGVTIGFSDGENEVFGCTTIGVEGPYWPGNGDSVLHCQADSPFAPIVNNPYQHDRDQVYSVTVLDETEVYGNDYLSFIMGSGHDVTLWNSSLQPRSALQAIHLGGPKIGMRYDPASPPQFSLSNSQLTNWTDMPVVLDAAASGCTVSSYGAVSNNGSGNTVSSLSAATITASSNSGSVGNTLDGDAATSWSATGIGEWIQYDLGTTRNLSKVAIQWGNGTTRNYHFELQTAASASGPWEVVFAGNSRGTVVGEEYVFPTRNARFVRVVGQGNTSDNAIEIVDLDIDLKDRFAMVKAKSEAGAGFIAQNTLDGDYSTRWAAEGVGQWIQYDFLESRLLESVSLAWHAGDSRSYSFEIGVSDHPMGPWTTVYSGASSGSSTALEEYAFEPAVGRFVRVTGLGNSQDDWNNVTEIFLESDQLLESTTLPDPIACWTLDEGAGSTVGDVSGNGHHASQSNASWSTGVDGGSALSFNGTDSTVTLPASAFGSLGNEVTVAFWAYGGVTQPVNNVVFNAEDSAGNRILNIHLPWSNGQVYWDAGHNNGYDRINKTASGSEIAGTWNHWVFTKDAVAGTMQIFLNGTLWHSGTGKTRSLAGTTVATLGSAISGLSYDGLLDNVVLYDSALTLAQVAALYDHSAHCYQSWVQSVSLAGADSAWTADPDGDAFDNLLEYALGSDPLVNSLDLAPHFRFLRDEDCFHFTYRRRRDAEARGLSYLVVGTENPAEQQSWTADGLIEIGAEPLDDDFELVTVEAGRSGKGFFRLQVTLDTHAVR
ncbi:discoidin domain-containing protein [Roseibacillus ishigakijimensis]|uniref:Discoidin domain-containing protein n=1 Tax=Roseibacillus ishigakijimensis TaxID=454146 RepID=A0A934VKZ7_9BACT|nr:discoidin domain-containing protein [Roseibacillus ishigakijimensis]MBK1834169.1 discoidin domain-containing protein [Roseibacillus ishigakijimensis]